MKTSLRLFALLLVSTMITSCQKEEETTAEPPRPVLSMIAAASPAATLTLPGTVAARVETQFGFRVLGQVIARNVKVGDLVKKGDVLAAIDPLSLELAVRSAESDLANGQAQLANAQINEQRQKTLFEKQSGAKANFETAELERKTAEATVAKARANLDKANEQLSYARLLAEFDGVVTATSAEVGQVVSAGQAIATVARPESRDAVIDVPEVAAGLLKQGAVFNVSLQLNPAIRAKGVVREVTPEADDATRTSRTKLTLIDPPDQLRLGSVITASAVVDGESVIRIPSSAIRIDAGQTFVWIASQDTDQKSGHVTSRPVTLDGEPIPGSMVTVTKGVAPGDRIVTAGVNKLKDGQAVRIDQETAK
jgi:RND family efflux transporter MFP subunit